ncbi:MAG TPA: hypothetical protein VIZ32_07015, partial [Vicinamibacterales bacterium]
SDSRLPNGGGYSIGTLYDVVPSKAGQVNTLSTLAENYGKQYQYFNGLDVTVSLRQGGLTLQGGTSTGQNVADACEVRANLPELNTNIGAGLVGSSVTPTSVGTSVANPYCHVAYGWLTQLRGLGSYVIPKIDAQVSAVFQSKPGALLSANYAMPAAQVATFLGRLPSGNVPNVTINLIEPGSLYGDRINQLDFRIAKNFTFGSTRSMISADLYNVLNTNPVISYNNSFTPNGPWLQPNAILTGRLVRISVDFNF